MIEKNLDVEFIAPLALREKQIQQNYRPIIGVHKWFARRPGTLFRGLLLSEFVDKPLRDTFYQANHLEGLHIADPFMGGGTPLIEANRVGCDVTGIDINPMAYWIVKQEIEHLDLESYSEYASLLVGAVEAKLGHLYRTNCEYCGNQDAHVKYFIWVKYTICQSCGHPIDLFPSYLLASDARHPKNVFICSVCGKLTETANREAPGSCQHCGAAIRSRGPASHGRVVCPHCQTTNRFPDRSSGPPPHRLVALEYFCPSCRHAHVGRYFKAPDALDLGKAAEAQARWDATIPQFVPEDEIPSGDETNRLHRWGYARYREMFGSRQLLGLEESARVISSLSDERVRNALATNLSDLLRYQNMLCRYDTKALKSLDIFSIHGFPVGLVQCESNLLGIMDPDRGVPVGSGGWLNIIEKYRRAKAYCDAPFEVRHIGPRKQIVYVPGEWIGDVSEHGTAPRTVDVMCADAAQLPLKRNSIDAVFTDPPYYGNVQYAELMDFCYVWLRRLLGTGDAAFSTPSTRDPNELTGNVDMGRGLEHFTNGLSSVFRNMAAALKPGGPFCFTYHHNVLEAYYPICVALLDARLTCSATLPCPAEMAASIHINGTGSSIVDSVFISRSTGKVARSSLADSVDSLARLVQDDLDTLERAGVHCTLGDARCLTFGHITRLAVWNLRTTWTAERSVGDKLVSVAGWIATFGSWPDVEARLGEKMSERALDPLRMAVNEESASYGNSDCEVSF